MGLGAWGFGRCARRQFRIPNSGFRISRAGSRIPNPESRIPRRPEPRVPCPVSRVPDLGLRTSDDPALRHILGELLDQLFEYAAALFVIVELIEAGTRRRQQHGITGARADKGLMDSGGEISRLNQIRRARELLGN